MYTLAYKYVNMPLKDNVMKKRVKSRGLDTWGLRIEGGCWSCPQALVVNLGSVSVVFLVFIDLYMSANCQAE